MKTNRFVKFFCVAVLLFTGIGDSFSNTTSGENDHGKLVSPKGAAMPNPVPVKNTEIKKIDESSLYACLVEAGVKNADVVLRQAIYESGHFKSNIFKTKNNLFGFRITKNYMKFDSWEDCVLFYKRWQDKHYKDDSEDYYKFLQRINYCGNKKFPYSKELKKIHVPLTAIENSES